MTEPRKFAHLTGDQLHRVWRRLYDRLPERRVLGWDWDMVYDRSSPAANSIRRVVAEMARRQVDRARALGIAEPPAVEDLVGSLGGLQDA